MNAASRLLATGRTQAGHRAWLLVVIGACLLAPLSGCASSTYLSVRRVPQNPLAGPLELLSRQGPKPTERTAAVLRRYDLSRVHKHDPAAALERLQEELAAEPSLEKMYAFAELAYVHAKKAQALGQQETALDLFSASVAQTYLYLFSPEFEGARNQYDPQFRQACDVYNAGLEELLRIINKQGRLKPGETYTLRLGSRQVDVQVVIRGPWREGDFERFEFVSDYEVKGLVNRHVTFGLGVPLIAIHRQEPGRDPASGFYPPGMSLPVTAILRAAETPCQQPDATAHVACALELHDPLVYDHVQVAGHWVPLETDLTTPLGFFLDTPAFQNKKIATWGLLNPNSANELRGLYMLEAFDPRKIPVLMVHGLWSSPETWTEMLNDLRSLPELRNRYQFWSYLYPTGQPFWISATQLRRDLDAVRNMVDARRRYPALDQMVLVGHSMGGLVARLQTLDSGDDYWHILSNRPFAELKADPELRERLAQTVFFKPNPSIRCVVTIGTPHRGSDFANDYTRWLGRKLIKLPAVLIQSQTQLARDNPDFFRNTELLTITTSIDSLSPDAPVLPVMNRSEPPRWVRHHNVVGVVSKQTIVGRISESGDGVVPYESGHLDDADSEIVVDADHVHIHQHPRTILQVRRILLDHSAEMYAEAARHTTLPAGYDSP